MSKRPNIIPSQQLNVALPLPIYSRLSAHLFSELEGRVPHGAYSRFLVNLLQQFFSRRELDLAPFLNCDPGAFVVSGTPEAIAALGHALKGELNEV